MANYIKPFLFTLLFSPILMTTAVEHGDVRIVAMSGGAPQSTTKTRGNPGLPTRGQRPYRSWSEQVGAGYAHAPTPAADATASDIGGRGADKVLCAHVRVRDDKYCLGRRAQGPLSADVGNLPLHRRVFPLSVIGGGGAEECEKERQKGREIILLLFHDGGPRAWTCHRLRGCGSVKVGCNVGVPEWGRVPANKQATN